MTCSNGMPAFGHCSLALQWGSHDNVPFKRYSKWMYCTCHQHSYLGSPSQIFVSQLIEKKVTMTSLEALVALCVLLGGKSSGSCIFWFTNSRTGSNANDKHSVYSVLTWHHSGTISHANSLQTFPPNFSQSCETNSGTASLDTSSRLCLYY